MPVAQSLLIQARPAPSDAVIPWPARVVVRSPQVPTDGNAEADAHAALAAGDRERALRILVEAYQEHLFRYCKRQLGDRELAKDVLQTVFLQAFEGLLGFGRDGVFRAWLFAIARNRCIDALRTHARSHKVVEANEKAAPQEPPQARLPEMLALSFCLSRLPPTSRETLLLFHEGFTYSELSKMLGDQPSALAMRVHRALVALRSCLAAHGAGR